MEDRALRHPGVDIPIKGHADFEKELQIFRRMRGALPTLNRRRMSLVEGRASRCPGAKPGRHSNRPNCGLKPKALRDNATDASAASSPQSSFDPTSTRTPLHLHSLDLKCPEACTLITDCRCACTAAVCCLDASAADQSSVNSGVDSSSGIPLTLQHSPLEVVHQRPVHQAPHIGAVCHGFLQLRSGIASKASSRAGSGADQTSLHPQTRLMTKRDGNLRRHGSAELIRSTRLVRENASRAAPQYLCRMQIATANDRTCKKEHAFKSPEEGARTALR